MNFREVVIGAHFPVVFKSRSAKDFKGYLGQCLIFLNRKVCGLSRDTREEGSRTSVPGGLMPEPPISLLHSGYVLRVFYKRTVQGWFT